MPDKGTDSLAAGGGARAIGVSLSDFPVFDGNGCPDTFIRQCRRVAALGGIDEAQLSAIMAARCRGLALQAVENGGNAADVAALLTSAFGPHQRPETAAAQECNQEALPSCLGICSSNQYVSKRSLPRNV